MFALIGLAVVVAIVVAFALRKKPAAQIEETPEPQKLPPPKAKEPERAAEPEKPVKAAPPPPAQKKAEPEKPKAAEPPPPPPPAAKAAEPAAIAAPKAEPVAPPPPPPPAKAAEPEKPKAAPAAAREAAPAKRKDVEGLRKGLTKVRESEGFFGRLKALFVGKKEIDPSIVEQIEEVLLTSDVGVATTQKLLGEIKDGLQKKELKDEERVWGLLRERSTQILAIGGGGVALSAKPTVVMVVGVNGVGKTTTIGKLATRLKGEGKKVVLAAGDTFRAAAVQQLNVWGKRVGCEVVSGKDGANPGAVIFDAIQKAKDTGADVVLADTAGRLHTKTNLMDELKKAARTMAKAFDGAPHETLLVLDATNGQNAMQQAAMFKEALPISGIVLTKLDGTAKGGVILGICAEHELPVRYVGIGERAEDLREFNAEEFVEAMLGNSGQEAS
ncbi:MAG: signal recognition particle-docking protein FtsY [Polyangiaceae bacterium]|nr:signal recognition particle-docking protein FtsY [Polyangiaceae bacterium]